MRIKFQFIGMLALMISAASCKKDNFDAPTSSLKGKLVYQGEAINVEHDRVPFELYQYGFGKVGAIVQTFAQDGTYSSLLFNGTFKLIVPNGQGPFKWKQTAAGAPDSVTINMNGSQVLDLEVTPYYLIRTPQITAAGGKVMSNFKIEKIVTDATAKDIENVTLYVNKTQFVSGADNIANTGIGGGAITDLNNVILSATIPNIVPTQNFVFARIGLKIAGVEDRIFSPVVKLTF
ncbi:MAG: DUF3823 domain-containing protein [Ferruginibacter sp.]|nr:DUF3823 domain-containing protein [Ferruginibacter sp.]